MPWVLVADIGGTNARFKAVPVGQSLETFQIEPLVIPTDQTSYFEDALLAVIPQLGKSDQLVGVILALAAPVHGDIVKLTNASWVFDKAKIANACKVEYVQFRNDFEVQAIALPYMTSCDVEHLHGNTKGVKEGNYAVIGPGTGLGVAGLLVLSDGRSLPIIGEGGHMTYAPETDVEWTVSQGLRKLYGRVSYERILCGQGLVDVSRILGAEGIAIPKDVTTMAIEHSCPFCVQAVQLFLSALGRISGDIALAISGMSGVFIGGGVVPQLVGEFDLGNLVEAFLDKGRYAEHMQQVPLMIITNKSPAFIGLTACAKDLSQQMKM